MGFGIVDQYSLLHIASGIVAYFWGISFKMWFIIHALFEIMENTNIGINFINIKLKGLWPGGKPTADAPINQVSDHVFSLIGWILAYYVDYYGRKYELYPSK